MFGFGRGPTRQRRNSDVTININLDLKDILTGKQLVARYQVRSGRIKEAEIDIPPGIDNGMGIRFEGLGDDTIPNLPKGDLIARIKVINSNRLWSRSGNDLHVKLHVSIFECILGGKVEFTTLEGKRLELKIPKGTQPSATFSVPGYGVPDMQTGQRGHIFVKLNTIVPKIEDPSILKDIERIRDALS
jgi:DnaJ-class molecular chaperone